MVGVNGTATAGTSKVTFITDEDLAVLSIGLGGTVVVTPGSGLVLSTQTLAFAHNVGSLDLNDNDMIVDYTGGSPLAAIQT